MKLYELSAVFFMLNFAPFIEGASILALFSSLSYSDHLVYRGLISRLVQSGHAVVMMTPYPGHFTYPETERIVELDVGSDSGPFWDEYKKLTTNVDDLYPRLKAIHEFNIKLAIAQLKSKQMTALFINTNIKFDLVITEADMPMLYAVADKYQALHVAITPTNGKIHQYEAKGSPIHPFLYPDENALTYRNSSLWQKLEEINRHLQTKYEYYNNYLHLCEVAARKIFGPGQSLQDLEHDIDLLLIAANPLLIGNRPAAPGIVYTDRLHINSGLYLPQDLQVLLDNATKGVIYFSIGAIQEPESLSPTMLQTLADAFGELPYTVLWKLGNTSMINLPENVIAHSWFPQQEVLAHSNVKAFLTHGGRRSLEEAVYYEVPIIGLPLVKSRKVFIGEITRHGVGEILDPYFLEKDVIKATILAVASDETYKKQMSTLKDKVFNNIISGPENAVWWINFVVLNGGARHLRSPAVGYTLSQYYMLDTLTYLLVGTSLALWISLMLSRYILKRVRTRYLGRLDLDGKYKAL